MEVTVTQELVLVGVRIQQELSSHNVLSNTLEDLVEDMEVQANQMIFGIGMLKKVLMKFVRVQHQCFMRIM